MESEEIKDFYKGYADHIMTKRLHSKYPLRSYVHQKQYESVLSFVVPGMKVLDAGCGEGSLSFMMAKKGAIVTGVDLSKPNIEMCNNLAHSMNLSSRISFIEGDVEAIPFGDNHFDLVVSSHVLEHIPDFNKGLSEVMRVSKNRAIVAIPTICNPCSLVQVGGGWFYLKGIRSFLALPYGFLLMLCAFIAGKEGVDEGYVGKGLPHIFRFPKAMKKRIDAVSSHLVSYEASSICLPFFPSLLPLIKILDKCTKFPLFRNLGYGTTFVIKK